MAEYRIVTDRYAGFEVQIRRWWWPFWTQVRINTHRTVESAERFAHEHANGNGRTVIKNLGALTGSQTGASDNAG